MAEENLISIFLVYFSPGPRWVELAVAAATAFREKR